MGRGWMWRVCIPRTHVCTRMHCALQVEAYCGDNSPEATLNLGGSMLFIRAAFEAFRHLVRAGGVVGPAGVSQKLAAGGAGGEAGASGVCTCVCVCV